MFPLKNKNLVFIRRRDGLRLLRSITGVYSSSLSALITPVCRRSEMLGTGPRSQITCWRHRWWRHGPKLSCNCSSVRTHYWPHCSTSAWIANVDSRCELISSTRGFIDESPGCRGECEELAVSRSTNERTQPLLKSGGEELSLKGSAFKYQKIAFANYHLF